jgi:hypothetical protein
MKNKERENSILVYLEYSIESIKLIYTLNFESILNIVKCLFAHCMSGILNSIQKSFTHIDSKNLNNCCSEFYCIV